MKKRRSVPLGPLAASVGAREQRLRGQRLQRGREHGKVTRPQGKRRASWTTAGHAALSAVRAGVEGTISQAVRGFGLHRPRHVGQAKTHLQHVATAAAMTLARITEWLGGALPPATTRSRVRTLIADAA